MKKSYAFQWLIAIIATIFLVVMFLAVLHGGQDILQIQREVSFDPDSSFTILTYHSLLSLLKEYQAYCDTVMIRGWEHFFKVVVNSDSTLGCVADSSLVEYNRNKYRLSVPFQEDFIYWLENVKLKGGTHE